MRGRRSAGYLIMSNAGGSLSLRGLGEATSLRIVWTSTAPRIKNGPPAAGAVSYSFSNRSPITLLLGLRLSRKKMPAHTGRKFRSKNCENRGGWESEGGRDGGRRRRGSNGDGKQRRVQIEDLFVALSPLCPRAWLTNHPSATAPIFPRLPPARGVAIW